MTHLNHFLFDTNKRLKRALPLVILQPRKAINGVVMPRLRQNEYVAKNEELLAAELTIWFLAVNIQSPSCPALEILSLVMSMTRLATVIDISLKCNIWPGSSAISFRPLIQRSRGHGLDADCRASSSRSASDVPAARVCCE